MRRSPAPVKNSMHVHVRLFAVHREMIGTDGLSLDLPEGASVALALGKVVALYPDLDRALGSARVAVNRDYADLTTILREGDEVAIIPPVAGGEREPW